MKIKYLNITLIFCMLFSSLLSAYPGFAQNASDEFPTCAFPLDEYFNFWNDPPDPSIFDGITFGMDGCITPDTWVCDWNFGDGTTGNTCFFQNKQYQSDGDYTVNVVITDTGSEFEPASLTRTISVRTHDVAITKFIVPQSARASQTRQIVVYVRNNRYPENVAVDLFKSTVGDYMFVGETQQYVPVRSANRTTAFTFNYTFTAEDVRIGKVTFKAEAILLDVRDAWTADNTAISLPVRVAR